MYRTFKGKTVELVGQQESIYKHLKTQGNLTQLEALGVYGIYRLAARVCEMRRKGVPIDSVNKKDANGKVYAQYFLNEGYEWREPVGSTGNTPNNESRYMDLGNGYTLNLRQNYDGSFNVRVQGEGMNQNILRFNPFKGEVFCIEHYHDKSKIPEMKLL